MALASRDVGRGRLIAAAFSPAAESGDLGRHGVFVALMQALAEALTESQESAAPPAAGEPLRITATGPLGADGSGFYIEGPGSRPVRDAVYGLEPAAAVATLPEAPATGFYTWMRGSTKLGEAAVGLAPAESDLEPLSAEGPGRRGGAAGRRGVGRHLRGGEWIVGPARPAAVGLAGVRGGRDVKHREPAAGGVATMTPTLAELLLRPFFPPAVVALLCLAAAAAAGGGRGGAAGGSRRGCPCSRWSCGWW